MKNVEEKQRNNNHLKRSLKSISQSEIDTCTTL